MRVPPAPFLLALFVMAVAIAQPSYSYSANIQQMNYQFYYDGNAREHGPQLIHVVCDNCPPVARLALAPKALPVAIRMSEDMVPPVIQPRSEQKSRNAKVHFGKNSPTLKDPEKVKLAVFSRAAREFLSMGNSAAVHVEGYTCDLGSKTTNDRLANKRAQVVAAFLKKEGVHVNTVTGKGKCCYLTNDPAQKALNRRVEVTITGKGDKH